MKNIVTFIFLIISISLSSQIKATKEAKKKISSNLKEANFLFKNTFYTKALKKYEQIIDRKEETLEVVRNAAVCAYYTMDADKSIALYGRLFEENPDYPIEEDYDNYSQALKTTGDFDKSQEILTKKDIVYHGGNNLDKINRDIKYLSNISAIGDRFEIKNIERINTSKSEFSPIHLDNKLVFTGSRRDAGLLESRYGWDQQAYLDILYTTILSKNTSNIIVSSDIKSLSDDINTDLHEASASFSKDGKIIYFTSNTNFKKKRKKKKKKSDVQYLQIYKGYRIEDSWVKIEPLPFCSNKYSVEHPSLSADGSRLYFSSDMPGGYGSFDLYYVDVDDRGKYSKPKNLGPKINTPRREQFPFISDDGTLYFSSDGHVNYGGLDVFQSVITADSISKPDNIGLPINGNYDDFSFSIDSETKMGFFASNRPSGKGSDDIYSVKEILPLVIEDCYQYISVNVLDTKEEDVLDKATVYLQYLDEVIDSATVKIDPNNKKKMLDPIQFKVFCDSLYTVKAFKKGYQINFSSLRTDANRKKDTLVILKLDLFKDPVEDIVYDEMGAYKEGEAVKNKDEIAKEITDYKDGITKNSNIVKQGDDYIIKLEKIYFDYNEYYIRLRDRPILDKVYSILNQFPELSVEMGVHADIRGSEEYNMKLSERRASSIADYLFRKGIDLDRIITKAYGETKPIIDCKSKNCTEEEYEVNRRSEFTIKGF